MRNRVPFVLVAALVALAALVNPAGAEPVAAEVSQPQYSYADAVRETVWVDTGLPDPDGGTTRVAADIIRPAEAAAAGVDVPVIMDASPYYQCCGRGNESQKKTYDAQGRPVGFPLFYDNYFVPRGYAVVLVDLAGTNRSTGCEDVGGKYDVQSAKKVIDWLNGRADGYTAVSGGEAVSADWTSGKVGMIGKSWDGTVANGVAATGVDGLETIVPIGAISSWYDYYRASGANLDSASPSWLGGYVENAEAKAGCAAVHQELVDGAPENGDRTPFWQARDYTAAAAKVKASVFVVHGLNDLNVKAINYGQWLDALPEGVERKIWLSQVGHVDPFDFRRQVWVDTLHLWFDHYLLGIDNGVEDGPEASIERAPDQWVDEAEWAADDVQPTTLRVAKGSKPGLGKLGTAAPAPGSTESFTDDPQQGNLAWSAGPDKASKARVLFTSGPLAKDVRVAGTSSITVKATPNAKAARLSAVLVDYGPATTRNYLGEKEGIANLDTRSCWGESTDGDSACYLDTRTDTATVDRDVISRGWSDLGHYASLEDGQELTPGKAYTITFNLATTDRVIPKGHQLALIIGGTDADSITGTNGRPKLTVDLSATTVRVPLIGKLKATGYQLPTSTRAQPAELSAAQIPGPRG